jgi:hypothetical protein
LTVNAADLTRRQAQSIVNNLRQGVPSPAFAELLTVGQAGWIANLRENLESYIADGGSMVRIIKGEYGDGKTHLLQVVGAMSLAEGYATSYVDLGEARLNNFGEVYSAIVNHLKTEQYQDNLVRTLLRGWFETNYRDALDKHPDQDPRTVVDSRLATLMSFCHQLSGDFRAFVRRFLTNLLEQPEGWEESNEILMRWCHGEALDLRTLRTVGIFARIDRQTSKDAFRSIARILRLFGLKGLVILLDEVEQVLNQTVRVRSAAYQNVRELIDSADGGGGALAPDGCLLLFTATPELFISDHGFVEYKALWDRIKAPSVATGWVNFRAPVVDLTATPLGEDDLQALASRIREIHAVAHDWDPVKRLPNKTLKTYVQHIAARFAASDVRPPRIVVRTLVDVLDRVQLDPNFDPAVSVEEFISGEFETLVAEKTGVDWAA